MMEEKSCYTCRNKDGNGHGDCSECENDNLNGWIPFLKPGDCTCGSKKYGYHHKPQDHSGWQPN